MGQDWPDEDRWMWTNNREWRIKRKQLSLPFEYSQNFFWTNSWVVESNHRLQSGKLDFLCSSWKQQLKVLQTKSLKKIRKRLRKSGFVYSIQQIINPSLEQYFQGKVLSGKKLWRFKSKFAKVGFAKRVRIRNSRRILLAKCIKFEK